MNTVTERNINRKLKFQINKLFAIILRLPNKQTSLNSIFIFEKNFFIIKSLSRYLIVIFYLTI
jgi:hypothetical protein